MNTLVLPGMEREARNLTLSQWFTPPELALRMVQWADLGSYKRRPVKVLEPSAGNGSLVRAIEIDGRYTLDLQQYDCHEIVGQSFLELTPSQLGLFDLSIQNPPYEEGQDVDFIMHSFKFVPRVVGIYRSALVHGDRRYNDLWRWTDIKQGKWLRNRPQFGRTEKADGALSDFCALQLVARRRPRKLDEDMNLRFGWW